ncbi:MAG TPA: glycosyltransferase family 4 protein, partial [Pyrinomonadaceae bacterium]
SPPLISFLGALFTRIRSGRFIFWVMDLNPDEAIAAGWLKDRSYLARLLQWFLHYSMVQASSIVVLDRFVQDRIIEKGISAEKVIVLPPWPQDNSIRYDADGRKVFRGQHQLEDKFVVMYSGNHSPCHPLDTLLQAAKRLNDRQEIAFCFVGGGSEQQKVKDFARNHALKNVDCLPYQPFAALSQSLSAADLHTVVMGDEFAGILHPSKIYNILSLGIPFLYVGPAASHITDIAAEVNGFPIFCARHGDVDAVVQHILFAAMNRRRRGNLPEATRKKFARETVLPKMIQVVEGKSNS